MTRRFFSVQLLFSYLPFVLLCSAARAQEVLSRHPGETLSHFAQRLLPRGTVPASPVREITLGPFVHTLVLLFGETPENYDEGWVLTPRPGSPGQYRKYLLPPTDAINLSAVAFPAFQVRFVFPAPLRQGAAPSLLIIFLVKGASAVKEGKGRSYEHEYVTGMYRWTGHGFDFDGLSDRLAGLSDETAIRRKLHILAARRSRQR